jgi:hypothetical protein
MAAAAAPAPAPATKRRHTTALFSQSEWEHAQECWSRNDYASARPHLERLAALGDPAFEVSEHANVDSNKASRAAARLASREARAVAGAGRRRQRLRVLMRGRGT